MKLRPLSALALAVVLGALAGCSEDSAKDGGAGSTNDRYASAVKFSECMRDNGVSEFPDPDASGELTIDGVLNGSSLDPNSAAWNDALDACKDLEPSGFTGTKASPDQQDARLEFAQCIREHGVPDFPDPGPDDPLVDTNRIPSSGTEAGMTTLNAAMQTCGDLAEEAIGQ
jgi:hypothetical protein